MKSGFVKFLAKNLEIPHETVFSCRALFLDTASSVFRLSTWCIGAWEHWSVGAFSPVLHCPNAPSLQRPSRSNPVAMGNRIINLMRMG